MELAANDRLIVKNILVQQVGFLGDASERAKDNTELLTLTAEMLDALKMIVLFDGSQEKDRRAGLSEEDDCTKKPALTTDEGQRRLMEAKRTLEREIATGSLKGLFYVADINAINQEIFPQLIVIAHEGTTYHCVHHFILFLRIKRFGNILQRICI